MTDSPTAAERAAIREGYSALIRAKSPTSHIVETVTFALSETGQLVAPGGAFELDRLRMLMNAQPAALTEEQIEALVDAGDRALNDYYHERACSCDLWPQSCATDPRYANGYWDTDAFAIGLAAVLGLWEVMRAAAKFTVAELAAAAADVAALDAEFPGEPTESLHSSAGAVIEMPPVRPREDPHDDPVGLHHEYRVGRDWEVQS